jgi:hypothetical protein
MQGLGFMFERKREGGIDCPNWRRRHCAARTEKKDEK